MLFWILGMMLLSVIATADKNLQGPSTINETQYSCQNGSLPGMYGCFDTSMMTADGINAIFDDILKKGKHLYESIGNSTANATKETVLKPILDFECTTTPMLESLMFLQYVAEDKDIRTAAASLNSKMTKFKTDIRFMKKVFEKFQALGNSSKSWGPTSEEARYVRKIINDRLRGVLKIPPEENYLCWTNLLTSRTITSGQTVIICSFLSGNGEHCRQLTGNYIVIEVCTDNCFNCFSGILLNKTQQDKLKELHGNISDRSTNFSRTINEYRGTLLFNRTSLRGVSERFLNSLTKDNETGRYIVHPYGNHYLVIITTCTVEETRRMIYTAYTNRGKPGNSELLKEIADLRKEFVEILGYKSYVDFETEILMAKNATNVKNFLEDLATKLRPKLHEENEEYLRIKLKKCHDDKDNCTKELQMWDFNFLDTQIKQENYTINNSLIKEYFPIEVVQRKIFEIYEQLLGLKFEEINVKTWAENVTAYRVNDSWTGEPMGYFFLDLYPREGKYKSAAESSIQPSCIRPDGSRQLPIAALMTNFPKPTPSSPGLLTLREMRTFFHEFGHVLHDICSKTNVSYFSGTTAVERDFVEAPSQMFENWLHEPDVLKNMSCHYKNKSQLPDDVIQAIIQSEYIGLAISNMKSVLFSMYDQELHVNGSDDVDKLFQVFAKLYLNVTIPDDSDFPGMFIHIAEGYGGMYYSYLWSQVYSADMYLSEFKRNGTLHPEVGMKYRTTILERGGSRDAMELLIEFLGRKPTNDAFLKLKHLDQP